MFQGEFPADNGLVAPGMSCHFQVKFTPDSLADFKDVITVPIFTFRMCYIVTIPNIVA